MIPPGEALSGDSPHKYLVDWMIGIVGDPYAVRRNV